MIINFKQLNVVKVLSTNEEHEKPYIFEADEPVSNKFIVVMANSYNTATKLLEQLGIKAILVARNGSIRDFYPRPELSGKDFLEIIGDVNKIQDNTYVYYYVDLETDKVFYSFFVANNIKEARNIAKEFLTKSLKIPVLIKNLMLNPNGNSEIAHEYNLSNSYIGKTKKLNKYFTYDKYLVGVVKINKNLIETSILDWWSQY